LSFSDIDRLEPYLEKISITTLFEQ
jgi:hypothetical protein